MTSVTILRDGEPIGHLSCPPEQLAANVPEGCTCVEGLLPLPQRVDDIPSLIRRAARAEIAALESQQARTVREHLIGRGGTPAELKKRLEAIDDQITALRATLNE